MNADNRLIYEAMHSTRGSVLDVVVSELHKIHNSLNDMSNMIHLNRSSEVDQLLSKIRDLADMLITDSPASKPSYKGINKWSGPSIHVRHKADAPAKEEDAEHRSNAQNAAIAISLQKAGKK